MVEVILVGNDKHKDRMERYLLQRRAILERDSEKGTSVNSVYVEYYGVLEEGLQACVSPALFEMLAAPPNHFKQYLRDIDELKPFMSRDPETHMVSPM